MNTLIIRGIVILVLVLASLMAVKENRKPERPPPAQVSLTADDSGSQPVEPEGGYRNGIQFFIYIMIVAITLGVVMLKWIIPALGDRVAESFYSAPEKAEQSETQKAMALVAQGQYHQALAAFGKILEETPNDRFAVMETAKIYQTKLDDVDSAVEVLEKASAGEWPEDDKCFFLLKLADIHSTARSDFAKSREVLNQLILEFPD
ncbi:MAG TPA: tetratricopeptide repeat protein, partial [Verrucomicrobiales bacterium]|nr:tetratricopeptide repeat protein [Verrucomicrobiales bacterium]